MPFFPDHALVTRCIPGCSSRVSWDYDDGEPQTYEHPGIPPEVFPALGCSPEHLFALSEDPDLESIRHDAWQRVADYDRMLGAAHLSWISSLQYIAGPGNLVTTAGIRTLSGKPAQMRVPVRPVWDHDDDLDDLPF